MMSGVYLSKGLFPAEFFRPTVEFILRCQREDGSIPWFENSYTDPWDHIEAAMGLSIGGQWKAAEKAYEWLLNTQLPDGSWWAAYKEGAIDNGERRESNFVAYVATGVWHHYLVTGDKAFLAMMWPCVNNAMRFVLSLQTEYGDIHWAVSPDGTPKEDALITGCSSIYKSLECACNMATVLDIDCDEWLRGREKVGIALREMPERFDRTWESKARYSMDWFYPVLTGVLDQNQSKIRLAQNWDKFVEDEMGCRCVSDEPWITIAESCELTMALLAAGDHARAVTLYSWLHQWRFDDGSYWTGYQFVQNVLWPDEKPTWTAGAIILAADALTEHTGACQLFTSVNLLADDQEAQVGSMQ